MLFASGTAEHVKIMESESESDVSLALHQSCISTGQMLRYQRRKLKESFDLEINRKPPT